MLADRTTPRGTPRDIAINARRQLEVEVTAAAEGPRPVDPHAVEAAIQALAAIADALCEVCGERRATHLGRCGPCSAATSHAPICGLHGPRIRIAPTEQGPARALALVPPATVAHPGRSASPMTEITVENLFDLYLKHLERRKRKANTIRAYRSAYRRARPCIGPIPVASLGLADLVHLHESWSDTPTLADRAISYISAALTHAERLEIRPIRSNPCCRVERYNRKPELVRVDRTTLLEILEAIDYLAPAEEIDGVCAELFRLLVFTGARLSEIRTCRWEYVDLEEGVLRLPDSKTGEKEIALCEEASAILRRMPRGDSPWCFPGRDPSRARVGVRTAWTRIVEFLDIPELRRHDIRRGFATALWHAGVRREHIGELLGHKDPRTTKRYTGNRVSRLRGQVTKALKEAG